MHLQDFAPLKAPAGWLVHQTASIGSTRSVHVTAASLFECAASSSFAQMTRGVLGAAHLSLVCSVLVALVSHLSYLLLLVIVFALSVVDSHFFIYLNTIIEYYGRLMPLKT